VDRPRCGAALRRFVERFRINLSRLLLGIESMRLSYLRRCSETYLSGYCFHDAGVPTASLAA